MGFLNLVSSLNKKIPKTVRFVISLILLNIPPITYLTIADSFIAPLYVAIVFLLINITALIAYFKIKEVEVEVPKIRIKVRK